MAVFLVELRNEGIDYIIRSTRYSDDEFIYSISTYGNNWNPGYRNKILYWLKCVEGEFKIDVHGEHDLSALKALIRCVDKNENWCPEMKLHKVQK